MGDDLLLSDNIDVDILDVLQVRISFYVYISVCSRLHPCRIFSKTTISLPRRV